MSDNPRNMETKPHGNNRIADGANTLLCIEVFNKTTLKHKIKKKTTKKTIQKQNKNKQLIK